MMTTVANFFWDCGFALLVGMAGLIYTHGWRGKQVLTWLIPGDITSRLTGRDNEWNHLDGSVWQPIAHCQTIVRMHAPIVVSTLSDNGILTAPFSRLSCLYFGLFVVPKSPPFLSVVNFLLPLYASRVRIRKFAGESVAGSMSWFCDPQNKIAD